MNQGFSEFLGVGGLAIVVAERTYALLWDFSVKTCQVLDDDVFSWEGLCKSLKYKDLNFFFSLAFVGVADGESRTWPILPVVSHKVVHIEGLSLDGATPGALNSHATMTA